MADAEDRGVVAEDVTMVESTMPMTTNIETSLAMASKEAEKGDRQSTQLQSWSTQHMHSGEKPT